MIAAKKETHDKTMSRREQARADATATTDKVNQRIQSVGESAVHPLISCNRSARPC
jgi:hypothetical protein